MKKAAVLLFLIFTSAAFGQQGAASQLAGLMEDMNLLSRQVGQLRMEVDALKKENEELKRQVAQAGSAQTQATALAALRNDVDAQNEKTKKQILDVVAKELESLAKQMQDGFDKIAKAQRAQPATATTVSFSDDYPKEGVTYTVKAGDTLGKIAREHGASMRDIQNANRIADPARDLRAGQTIFIPKAGR